MTTKTYSGTLTRLMPCATALLFLAACSPRPASESAPASRVTGSKLDCLSPVTAITTAKQATDRYGTDLVEGDVGGPEGTQLMGATLYPNDAHRRLDIVWWDAERTAVSTVRARETGDDWIGPSGLHVGSTLAELETANGKPVLISGFGWDYGGYVVDFNGGKLAALDGGCHLSIRLDNISGTNAMPEGISGEGVQVHSDDARVRAYAPVITELSVGWPLP